MLLAMSASSGQPKPVPNVSRDRAGSGDRDDIMEFDLDSNPVDQRGRSMFIERFIHGEIYKARPDVNAVVHSHSGCHSFRGDAGSDCGP